MTTYVGSPAGLVGTEATRGAHTMPYAKGPDGKWNTSSEATVAPLDLSTPFFNAWGAAFGGKDIDACDALLADDFAMALHSSGKLMDKAKWLSVHTGMFANTESPLKEEKRRCLYETAEICVSHSFLKYPSGGVDALMYVQFLRDGKCYKTETGATGLKPDSPNFVR